MGRQQAKALNAAGFFAGKQGDYGMARRFHEESLAIGRQLTMRPLSLRRSTVLAISPSIRAITWQHAERLRRACSSGARIGDKVGMAASLNSLGILAYEQGDYARASELHGESLLLKRELGDQQGIAASLNNLGNVAVNQGDYTRARRLHEESLALKRGVGDQQGIATSLNNLGRVAVEQADYHTAPRSSKKAWPSIKG